MTWPSPSKLPLADACVYPWHRLAPPWREVSGTDATFGSAFHRAMQVAAVTGVSVALLEQIAEDYSLTPGDATRLLACVETAIDEVIVGRDEVDYRAAEVSVLYNVEADTARVLDEALDRDAIPEGHIHGTLDLVERIGGEVIISDWKTGGRSGELDARTDWQLATYALMVARAFGRTRVGVTILHVSESGVEPENHLLDGFDLAAHRGRLRALLARVEAGGPPRPGRHCTTRYCPIVAECPATQRALAEVQASADALLPMAVTIDGPEQAARVRTGIKSVEKALEVYRAALYAYVTEHGAIEVAPGVLFGRIEREGNERIDAEVSGVVSALQEMLGEHADVALDIATSKAGIERAARAYAKSHGITGRGALKQVADPVIARLRQLGAIKQGAPSVRYDEIVKKAKGEAAA